MQPGTSAAQALAAARESAVSDLVSDHPVLLELGELFVAAGFELAVVGGPVRDAILHRPVEDLDFATDARPGQVSELLRDWADAVWDVGARFGTIGAQRDGFKLEFTTYRDDKYDPDSRKPEVTYGNSLIEDLSRRDFTVNAMAVRLPGLEFVDPHDGIVDLAVKRLQTPGTPEESFSDDPLRMLRRPASPRSWDSASRRRRWLR